ncbi:MAG: hypothetical protein IKU18_04790 [Bacteroidales bacterium]|nr:hypothetical protein [Bacteroidales bacterium]
MFALIIVVMFILCVSVSDTEGMILWGIPLFLAYIAAFLIFNSSLDSNKKGKGGEEYDWHNFNRDFHPSYLLGRVGNCQAIIAIYDWCYCNYFYRWHWHLERFEQGI